jgi:hypothetical protein
MPRLNDVHRQVESGLSGNTLIEVGAEASEWLRAPGGRDKPAIDKQAGLVETLDEFVHALPASLASSLAGSSQITTLPRAQRCRLRRLGRIRPTSPPPAVPLALNPEVRTATGSAPSNPTSGQGQWPRHPSQMPCWLSPIGRPLIGCALPSGPGVEIATSRGSGIPSWRWLPPLHYGGSPRFSSADHYRLACRR